jgi:cobalt/nickel transport system permease protein
MHIPENYLSPATCAVMTAAMVPVWAHAVKKVNTEIPQKDVPMIGVGAAFSFLGMMFNIPLPGGTTGHAVGGTLIALLLGPDAACLAVTIALLIQALLFGDGGILSFGANCFNMAFVLPYFGYFIYKLIAGKSEKQSRQLLGAAVGSYAGINAAAFCAAIEFGIQPYLFHDAAGKALYCPYALNISIPAMMIGHLTLFGIAEIVYTVAVYSYVKATAIKKGAGDIEKVPDASNGAVKKKPIFILMAILIALVPLGLLAQGTAWGEWGADEIMNITGLSYVPSRLGSGWSLSSVFPDYTIAGIPDTLAYIISAVLGVAVLIIIFKIASSFIKEKTDYDFE